jgi:hypothetical protein
MDRGVARAAGPGGVSAAVAEAGSMTHQHLSGAECVPAAASGWRVRDPLPGRGLHQLA